MDERVSLGQCRFIQSYNFVHAASGGGKGGVEAVPGVDGVDDVGEGDQFFFVEMGAHGSVVGIADKVVGQAGLRDRKSVV